MLVITSLLDLGNVYFIRVTFFFLVSLYQNLSKSTSLNKTHFRVVSPDNVNFNTLNKCKVKNFMHAK